MCTEELWVVDRFEGSRAVLVSEHHAETRVMDRDTLPHGVSVGDVLRVTRHGQGVIRWCDAVVDEEAAARRVAEGEEILEDLRSRDPGGDVTL